MRCNVVEGCDTLSEGLSKDVIILKTLLDEGVVGREAKTILGGVKSSAFFESRETCFRQLDVMSGGEFAGAEDIDVSLHLGEIGDDILLEIAQAVDWNLDAILDGEYLLITILFTATKVNESFFEAVDVRMEVANGAVDGLKRRSLEVGDVVDDDLEVMDFDRDGVEVTREVVLCVDALMQVGILSGDVV